MGMTPHPHLVPKVLEKSRAMPLLTLRACVAYKKAENLPNDTMFRAPTRSNLTFRIILYVLIFIILILRKYQYLEYNYT